MMSTGPLTEESRLNPDINHVRDDARQNSPTLQNPTTSAYAESGEPVESENYSFWKEFYGDDFSEFQSHLRSIGADINTIDQPRKWDEMEPHMEAWFSFSPSEIEARIQAHCKWPRDGANTEWINNRYNKSLTLTVEQLDALDSLSALYSSDISPIAELHCREVERLLVEQVHTGGITRTPNSRWVPDGEGEAKLRGDMSVSRLGQGWNVTASISVSDSELAQSLEEEIAAITIERDNAVRATLNQF